MIGGGGGFIRGDGQCRPGRIKIEADCTGRILLLPLCIAEQLDGMRCWILRSPARTLGGTTRAQKRDCEQDAQRADVT